MQDASDHADESRHLAALRRPETRAGRHSWRTSILFELVLLLLSVLLGWLLWTFDTAQPWAWGLTLLPYLARHLHHLVRLTTLIHRHHRLSPPFPIGLWGELYRTIAQYQQRARKGRQRQIRFSRRFREAANAVPDALVILDRQHRIEWANPAAASLLNIHWPDDAGHLVFDRTGHLDLPVFEDRQDLSGPLEMIPEHDRALMLSLHIAPFGERKRQRLLIGRDITKVYHLNMIRRDFVANASHELRTPLTVIAGFLENLKDAPTTPAGHRRPLSLMHNQATRMRSIIEDLLTLSRLEMNDRIPEQHAVTADVPSILQLIVLEAQALSEGQHQMTLDVDESLMLLGEERELRSAFSNLIYNAVRHTPPGTQIRIYWGRGAEGPELRVQDEGPGIAPEHLPRLTERFYRVDKARSRDSGGTGLGLAIVKHILNRHGGRLSIASELGRGSTFSCMFPDSRARVRLRTRGVKTSGLP